MLKKDRARLTGEIHRYRGPAFSRRPSRHGSPAGPIAQFMSICVDQAIGHLELGVGLGEQGRAAAGCSQVLGPQRGEPEKVALATPLPQPTMTIDALESSAFCCLGLSTKCWRAGRGLAARREPIRKPRVSARAHRTWAARKHPQFEQSGQFLHHRFALAGAATGPAGLSWTGQSAAGATRSGSGGRCAAPS